MVEKSEHSKVSRKDGNISFCPGKIDADDDTCILWAAFSEGLTSQQSGYQGNKERCTEGLNWFPTRRHHARLRHSLSHRVSESPPSYNVFQGARLHC